MLLSPDLPARKNRISEEFLQTNFSGIELKYSFSS